MADDDRRDPDAKNPHSSGVSRRGFLASVGAGTLGAAVACRVPEQAPGAVAGRTAGEPDKLTLVVNGRRHRLLVEPRWSLLYVLRNELGLTGTKVGCERGECGACTVLIDDEPRYACMTLAVEAEGKAITTVEGLMHGEQLGPTQQAFLETDAFQCGYCTPGQVMAVEALRRRGGEPDDGTLREGLSGNLCRCGAYAHIVDAARRVTGTEGSHGK